MVKQLPIDVLTDAIDAMDSYEVIDRANWRHGHKDRVLFKYEGQYYATWIDVHHDEGWQLLDPHPVTAVKPVEKTVTEWVPIE